MTSFSKLLGWPLFLLTIVFSIPLSPAQTSTQPIPAQYPNVLNIKGSPQQPDDRTVFSFSDMGAWFSYALPDQAKYYGSFSGPFLMTQGNGVWTSPCLSQMELYNPATGETYSFENAKNHYSLSLPGRLRQGFELERPGVSLQVELIFASSRTAMMHIQIRPLEGTPDLLLGIRWKGYSLLQGLSFGKTENSIQLRFADSPHIGAISCSEKHPSIRYASKEQYQLAFEGNDISAPGGWQLALTHSICFDANEWALEKPLLDAILADPQKHLQLNDQRWTKMLGDLLPQKMPADQHRLAVKCLETLVTNWRSPAGFLKHEGLFPSYNYEWFHGFWAWDSWKHAVALAKVHPELAQNQILAMFDFQNPRGMIADCVYRDTVIEQHNWRNSKPSLAAWAAWKVFEKTADTAFLRALYPRLVRYHQWWYSDRDHDQNGLCEYGSTDGSVEAAKWESGMDNAVRFDEVEIVQNKDSAWSLKQESVDLNAYLYAEKRFLSRICDVIGEEAAAQKYREASDKLKEDIRRVFFDSESGWFYDVQLESKEHVKVMGPEGWIPLWAEIATPKQAKAVARNMLDTSQFATYIPFPTLAANHPQFSPQNGYWRGPVWLDQAYFAMEGLQNYGYKKDASRLKLQLIERLEGLKEGEAPIRENYHPLTGKGLEARHFSWSAALLLLMMWGDDY